MTAKNWGSPTGSKSIPIYYVGMSAGTDTANKPPKTKPKGRLVPGRREGLPKDHGYMELRMLKAHLDELDTPPVDGKGGCRIALNRLGATATSNLRMGQPPVGPTQRVLA